MTINHFIFSSLAYAGNPSICQRVLRRNQPTKPGKQARRARFAHIQWAVRRAYAAGCPRQSEGLTGGEINCRARRALEKLIGRSPHVPPRLSPAELQAELDEMFGPA